MKTFRNYFCIFALAATVFVGSNELIAQDETEYEDEIPASEYVPGDIFKSIFIDAGYGSNALGFGLGFRYWKFGVSFGVSGIGESMPSYDRTRTVSTTEAIDMKKYAAIGVTTDLYYFYDINEKYTAFVNVGYGVGSDSLFAKRQDDTKEGTVYRCSPATETNSGITFGLGFQYFFEKWIGIGVGYQTRRGVYAQFNYYWY